MKMQCLRILFDAHKFRVHSQIRGSRLSPASPILADLKFAYIQWSNWKEQGDDRNIEIFTMHTK